MKPKSLIDQILSTRLVSDHLGVNEGNIKLVEVMAACKKLKRGKATGPDGLPVDVFKELGKDNFVLLQKSIE